VIVRSFIYNFKTVVLTTCLFLTVWLIFAEFNFDSLMVGVFFIFLAVAMNQWLLSVYKEKVAVKSSIRLSMLPNFILFFIKQSIIGGFDTAKRAVSPSLNITPGFIKYKTRFLGMGLNSHLFVNLVSLLPGSLIVLQDNDGILIHVLALNDKSLEDIAKCEVVVASLYGIDIHSEIQISKVKS
jgi:multicomponent Na+:H+ antiporter subunit E